MKHYLLPSNFESEDEVKLFYGPIISQLMKCSFSARFRTDGIFYSKKDNIKILAEFKVHGDLSNNNDLFIRCIIQVLCYIKKIEDSGEMIPNIIFIANEKHFAIFDSNLLKDYIKYINSGMVPSTMFSNPPKDLRDLLLKKINIKKYKQSDLSFLKELIENFKDKTVGLKMSINNNNISRIFEDFITANILNQKLSDNQKVALFASIIFDECNNIEGKPNQIVTPYLEIPLVKINRKNYDEFLLSIKSINKPSSKNEIISQSDRLIEEVSRRFHGEFYTPKIWVDEAHKMIEEQFGFDWKEKYVVWDPACGTGNLIRDYYFKELYCSTLFQSDIDIMNQRGYQGLKFQYDFLNDDVYPKTLEVGMLENKLERCVPTLVKSLENNKEIIILFNPPYMTSSGIGYNKSSNETIIKKIMPNYGQAKIQLYTQFIYRVITLANKYKNKNINIALFHPTIYFSGSSYKTFRIDFFKQFKFEYSMMFNAGDFSSVKNSWAISFSIFSSTPKSQNKFICDIKNITNKSIKIIGKKKIYNNDLDKKLNIHWMTEDIKGIKKIDFPIVSNPINIREKGEGKLCEKAFGFLIAGNSSRYNNNLVSIYCAPFVAGGISIIKENFMKSVASFTARKTIKTNWMNDKEEYLIPNIIHPEYERWNKDAIIYSLFNGSSNQSSLRKITYKNKSWDIKNQFFWMSNEQMKQLSEDNSFDELYQDSIIFNQERFIYQELQTVISQLSPDAINVFNKANDLVIKSFPERKRLHAIHPEYHLNAWDIGWYQIKLILKECFKDDLKEFNILYKTFEDRMREGVYKFGFLK